MSYTQALIRTLSEQNTKTIPQPPGPGDLLPIEFVWINRDLKDKIEPFDGDVF